MHLFKHGGHRLFEKDPETARIVSEMLLDLEKHGMDAVRRYSSQFDDWNPPDFELSPKEITASIARLDPQLIADTEFCQDNVRRFAQAQLATLLPLEIESQPGVILGHKHIPVQSVGSYIPGGRYPMFGSAQMSIIPAQGRRCGSHLRVARRRSRARATTARPSTPCTRPARIASSSWAACRRWR